MATSTGDILRQVSDWNVESLETLIEQLFQVKARRVAVEDSTDDALLEHARRAVPSELLAAIDRLFAKRDTIGLEPAEEIALGEAIDEMELRQAERLRYLKVVADRRGVSIETFLPFNYALPETIPPDCVRDTDDAG
jgi:hypothetical protein